LGSHHHTKFFPLIWDLKNIFSRLACNCDTPDLSLPLVWMTDMAYYCAYVLVEMGSCELFAPAALNNDLSNLSCLSS
jgi:hypothetical protein